MKECIAKFIIPLIGIWVGMSQLAAQPVLGNRDSLAILKQFYQQEDAWNRGDINQFMQAYWPSEQLVFVGADGPTYGWDPVLANYHRRYPDVTSMGKLKFGVLKLSKIDASSAFLIGTYHLTRTIGDLQGVFTLVWRKFGDNWLIVSDHTSAAPDPGESVLTTSLDELLRSHFKDDEPGGALLVARGDQVLFAQGYGVADIQTGEKITDATVLNTGSISKTFVANAILILAERGLLSVQDPITKYFTFAHPEVVEQITIEHLLSHTSGLPDLRNVGARSEFFLTAGDRDNFEPLLSAERLNASPGERFEYSNPAYNGLALIVEQVSGMKWQDFVREEIFAKAGMPNSEITDGAHPSSGVAHAYNRSGDGFVENDFGEFPTFCAAGNGGVWCSVRELFAYERALQSATFLSEEAIRKSRTVFHPSEWRASSPPRLGHSWWIGEHGLFANTPFGKHMIYHTGSQGGFRAFHVWVPEEETLVVGLFNRPIERVGLLSEIMTILSEEDWAK